jgi:hypothetical protein
MQRKVAGDSDRSPHALVAALWSRERAGAHNNGTTSRSTSNRSQQSLTPSGRPLLLIRSSRHCTMRSMISRAGPWQLGRARWAKEGPSMRPLAHPRPPAALLGRWCERRPRLCPGRRGARGPCGLAQLVHGCGFSLLPVPRLRLGGVDSRIRGYFQRLGGEVDSSWRSEKEWRRSGWREALFWLRSCRLAATVGTARRRCTLRGRRGRRTWGARHHAPIATWRLRKGDDGRPVEVGALVAVDGVDLNTPPGACRASSAAIQPSCARCQVGCIRACRFGIE